MTERELKERHITTEEERDWQYQYKGKSGIKFCHVCGPQNERQKGD